MAPKRESGKLVAENRRARFNYEIEDTIEAGIVLTGSEVKSLRAGKANIAESYASNEGGELFLINARIDEYKGASRDGHEPTRHRKLLLHKAEIRKLIGRVSEKGLTLVPVRMYLKKGRVKVAIALAKGKQAHDKRETIKRREIDRETRAAIKGQR